MTLPPLILGCLQPSADARKVDEARWTALLIPRPPLLTGKVACNQESSLGLMFEIAKRISRRMESYSERTEDERKGVVLKMCSTLDNGKGVTKEGECIM